MKPIYALQANGVSIGPAHVYGRRRVAFITALTLSWPLLAAADCESRKARPAEAEFNARAIAALVAALPPVPQGVVEVDARPYNFNSVPAIGEVLCEGTREGEFSVTARRQYSRKHSEAERRQLQARYDALTAQFHALKATPPEKAAEQQALRQRSNAAWQATRDAEKAGDKAAAQASDAQYRSLRDQADAIDAQHQARVKAQLSELDQRRTAIDLTGQKVDIVLSMNLQRLPRASADNTSGAYGAASPGKSAGLKVHNVSFSVGGTDGPLRQALAAAIDQPRLQALVGKPLPGTAESAAYAAGALPVTVADPPAGAGPAAPIATASPSPPAPAGQTAATLPIAPEPAAEPIKKAVDAVNMFRGLIGR
jgi:hypothetical protein